MSIFEYIYDQTVPIVALLLLCMAIYWFVYLECSRWRGRAFVAMVETNMIRKYPASKAMLEQMRKERK